MNAHQRGAADDDVGQGAGGGNESALACRLQRHRAERDRTHSWNEKYGGAMTDDLVNKLQSANATIAIAAMVRRAPIVTRRS